MQTQPKNAFKVQYVETMLSTVINQNRSGCSLLDVGVVLLG